VIETDTLSSDTTTWTTGTLSGAYDHLCVMMLLKSDAGSGAGSSYYSSSTLVTFNGDTGSNYGMRDLQASSSTYGYYQLNNSANIGYPLASGNAYSDTFGAQTWWIPNYTASTAKSIIIQSYGASKSTSNQQWGVKYTAASWNSSSAITSISMTFNGGYDFMAKSTYTIYGINGA